MKFNYETQGATTYLVCELDPSDKLDTLTLGMLTNNHINGLAPVLYTEMDGHRLLKYNISAKVTVSQFFVGSMNKQRAMQAFRNILNGLCSTDEYMIDQNCFSVKPEHIFMNVSNCEAALICIPVDSSKNINAETATLFKQILSVAQFDTNEDAEYITRMTAYLNSGENFTVYGLRDLMQEIESSEATPIPSVQQIQQTAPKQIRPAFTPVSSFDSTISIEDMPSSVGGHQQVLMSQGKSAVNPQSAQPQPQIRRPVPVQPVQPQINVQQKSQQFVQPPQVQRSTQPPVHNVQKTPAQSNPKFAVPGQATGFAIPGQVNGGAKQPPASQVTQPQQPVADGHSEKKMSFWGLMMHYNKENAAMYKAQKEANKAAKEKAANQSKAQSAVPYPNQQSGFPAQQNVSTMGGSLQGQQSRGVQQNYRMPVQPLPVQNSFNETTVLDAVGGETTVLGESSMPNVPYLTRVKTGERVYINKPVFRIGKEKSYVDFFIADNTAISRSHCNIHTENGGYYIEDTNSTNHTYINGRIINSNVKIKLSNGDQVRLANEEFIFSN